MEAGNEVRVDPEISFNKVTLILTLAGLLYCYIIIPIILKLSHVLDQSSCFQMLKILFFFSLYIADSMENYPSLLLWNLNK